MTRLINIVFFFNIFLVVFFSYLESPLSIMLSLVVYTFLIRLRGGLVRVDYWFSYTLFLVFCGGLLILFIYTTCILSRLKFTINFSPTKLLIRFLVVILLFILYMYRSRRFQVIEERTIYESKWWINSISVLYKNTGFYLMYFLFIYLLFALLVVRKLCVKFSIGALRAINR